MDGDLTEHFAVEQNAGVHQAIHEPAVTGASHSASGRDTGDPKTSHVATTLATVTPGVRSSAGQRDLGLLLVTASGSPVTASGTENSFAGFGASSTFGSTWHVEHSF